MITRAFCRCNSGHYFTGEFCPFDGWTSPAARELARACERLVENASEISVEALRKAGVSSATLKRTILITFGSPDSAFEALSPADLVVAGRAEPVRKLDRNFK